MQRNAFLLASTLLAGCALSAGLEPELDAGTEAEDAAPPGELDASTGVDGGPPDGGWIAGDDAGTLPEDDAGPPPDPDPEPDPSDPTTLQQTVRVLHWNIAGGKENDCQTFHITRAVRRFVRDHDVDFVGLNEVCPSQHDSIRRALRELWGVPAGTEIAAFVGDETARVVGNGIYSRFGFRDVTVQRVGEDRYGVRNLICGQVSGLRHLRFCSAHLTPGDTAARAQLARVLERIEGWWADRRDTVILSGDLNLQANDVGLNTVYSPAIDTRNNGDNRGHYHEVDDSDPEHCPGFGERSLPGTAGGPCHAGGKIDFIFVRANRIVDDRYSGDTLNIPSDCTGVCSDHRAVLGRARLRIRVE